MTTPVEVIIPWRGGCHYREGALLRVLRWWKENHPDWGVRVGEYPEELGPWCKGLAVRAVGEVDDDTVVIVSDADVICEEVGQAVASVANLGESWSWAMPHLTVARLNELATAKYIHGGLYSLADMEVQGRGANVMRVYKGYPGGGLVVLRGEALNRVPIDPRFRGYGQEDHSWSLGLHQLAGAPWRGRGTLWHLWHPPQLRMRPGVGSNAGLLLWNRYRGATTPEAMRALVSEARMVF